MRLIQRKGRMLFARSVMTKLLEEKRDKMGRPFFTAESSVLLVLAHPALAKVGTTAGLVYYGRMAPTARRRPSPRT